MALEKSKTSRDVGGGAGERGKGSGGGSRGKASSGGSPNPEAVKAIQAMAGGLAVGATGGTTSGPSGKPSGTGTTTSWQQTPGAVPAVPDPSLGQVASALTRALSFMTGGTGIATGAASAADSDQYGRDRMGREIDEATGGVPGPQRGWQPDKYRGQASTGGIGGAGGAVGDSQLEDETGSIRSIPGRSYGAGTMAMTGDSDSDEEAGAGTNAVYSDVILKDRRKPKNNYGAGTEMVTAA